NMQKVQQEIAALEVTGSAGGGMVTVTLSGAKECRKVRIDPSVLSDPEMAEDLVAAAFNDASNRIDTASREKMAAATAGLPIPPGMKLPFCPPPPAGSMPPCRRAATRRPSAPARHADVFAPCTADRGLPDPARRRPETRPAHGLPRARARTRGRAPPGCGAGRRGRARRPLRALPGLQRGPGLRHLRQPGARPPPAVRGRVAG